MTRNVTEVELEHGVSAGIRLRSLAKWTIPVFEEQDVRIQNNMSLAQWDELPYMDRVMLVAVTRIRNAVKNLQSEAEAKAIERRNKVK